MVYQGTTVTRGRGKALAVDTGQRTEMGRIASLVVGQPRQETRVQRELSSVGRYLAVAAAALCVIVFLLGLLRGVDSAEMLLIAASLAVAAIPEGLPAAATIVLALDVPRMAARHVIVRRLASVETLGAVTTIFTDKTGTLTLNRMSVEEAWPAADQASLCAWRRCATTHRWALEIAPTPAIQPRWRCCLTPWRADSLSPRQGDVIAVNGRYPSTLLAPV